MSRINRLLSDAKTSIEESYRIIQRIASGENIDEADISSVKVSATQAEQAAKELNQLIGMLTMKYHGD